MTIDQQAVASYLRDRADELIAEIRDVVLFSTRKMDAPSQRRVLRTYGATFRYLSGETPDPDEPAPPKEE